MTETPEATGIVVNNGKRLMSLDEMARAMPGMDSLMAEISSRAGCLYHAARAGNWALAGYYCRTLGKHLDLAGFVRPRYAEAITEFLSVDYAPVRRAINEQDGDAFEAAWADLVERVNHWHAKFGKHYIVWRTPQRAPADLDLTPGITRPQQRSRR